MYMSALACVRVCVLACVCVASVCAPARVHACLQVSGCVYNYRLCVYGCVRICALERAYVRSCVHVYSVCVCVCGLCGMTQATRLVVIGNCLRQHTAQANTGRFVPLCAQCRRVTRVHALLLVQ